MPTGATCDTLVARVEFVSWPAQLEHVSAAV